MIVCVNYKCLEYNRVDVSVGIVINNISGLRECIIYRYWYFLEINFRFQPEACDGYHYLMKKTMILNDVATVSVKGNDNRIHFWYISKDEGIHLFKNDDLSKKLDPYLI